MSAYDVAIRITAANGASGVLAMISKDLLGLHGSVDSLSRKFEKMGAGLKLAIGGAAAMLGGYEMLRGFERIADHGQRLIHQQNVLYRQTQDWQESVRMTARAYESITKAVPTASGVDVLRSYTELRSVLGASKALGAVPMSLKMEALLQNMTGQSAEGEGFKLWRALEMKGVTMSNPGLANSLANEMVQIISGSGGKVNASTFQSLAQRGGAAWIAANAQAIGPYAVMAADLGGPAAGTALMTLRQLLTGAVTISRQQLDVFQKAGLIDMSKVTKVPGSNSLQVGPGAIYNSLQGQDNIFAWAQSIAPKLHKLADAIGLREHQDPGKVFDSLIAKIGRNRNAIKMLTMFTDPGFVEQIDKDLALWNQTMGLDRAYTAMLGIPTMVTGPGGRVSEAASDAEAATAADHADYQAVKAAMWTQWDSMLEAMGGPFARAAIPWMQELTATFNAMGAWSLKHQDATKIVADITGISGVLLTLGGAAAAARGALMLLSFGLFGRTGAAAGAAAAGAGGATAGGAGSGLLGLFLRGGVGAGTLYTVWKLLTGDDRFQHPGEANKQLMKDLGLPVPEVIHPTLHPGGGVHIQDWDTPQPSWWERYWNFARAKRSLHASGYSMGLSDPALAQENGLMLQRGHAYSQPITVQASPVALTANVKVMVGAKEVAAAIFSEIEGMVARSATFFSGAGGLDTHAAAIGPGGIGHM